MGRHLTVYNIRGVLGDGTNTFGRGRTPVVLLYRVTGIEIFVGPTKLTVEVVGQLLRLPIQIILFPVADIIVGPELEQLLPDLFHGIGCGGLDRLRDHVPYHLPHEILGRSRLVLPGGPRVGVSVGEIVDRRFYVTTENGVLAGLLVIRYGVIDLVYLVPPLLDAVIVGFLLVLLLLDLVLDKHFLLFQ